MFTFSLFMLLFAWCVSVFMLSSRLNNLRDRYNQMDKQFLEMLEFQGQNARDIRELKGLK